MKNYIILLTFILSIMLSGCGEPREVFLEPDPEILRAFISSDKPSYPQYNYYECWDDFGENPPQWNIYFQLFVINIYDEALEDKVIPWYELEVWRDNDSTLVKTFKWEGTLSDTSVVTLLPGDTARISEIGQIFWFQQLTDDSSHVTPGMFEIANPFEMTVRGRIKYFDRAEIVEADPYHFRIYWRWDGCP